LDCQMDSWRENCSEQNLEWIDGLVVGELLGEELGLIVGSVVGSDVL
jgi:hypothetical protein